METANHNSSIEKKSQEFQNLFYCSRQDDHNVFFLKLRNMNFQVWTYFESKIPFPDKLLRLFADTLTFSSFDVRVFFIRRYFYFGLLLFKHQYTLVRIRSVRKSPKKCKEQWILPQLLFPPRVLLPSASAMTSTCGTEPLADTGWFPTECVWSMIRFRRLTEL